MTRRTETDITHANSRGGGLALAAGAALCALALIAAGERSPAGARGPAYALNDIGNFRSPVHVDNAPGATGLLFVVERAGRIRVLENGVKQPGPFLDIKDIVKAGGEEGLLSVAFHPDYDTNRRFYVYYTGNKGDIRVDQFKRKQGTALEASPNSRRKVIRIGHPNHSNHNGGQLQFNPNDGYLYMGTGDGGSGGDPGENAEDPDSLLGKLLRIDPQAGGGYANPPENPFVDAPGRDEIMALGLRNPWRFSFDADTGDIVIGDVGQDLFEEIDHETAADLSGANFGWDRYEGFADYEDEDPIPANYEPPIADFTHTDNGDDDFCAITGGYVVRDPELPGLGGEYLFADICVGELRTVDIPGGADATNLGLDVGSPSSFGEGENGQIYVVSLDGDVFALEQNT